MQHWLSNERDVFLIYFLPSAMESYTYIYLVWSECVLCCFHLRNNLKWLKKPPACDAQAASSDLYQQTQVPQQGTDCWQLLWGLFEVMTAWMTQIRAGQYIDIIYHDMRLEIALDFGYRNSMIWHKCYHFLVLKAALQ